MRFLPFSAACLALSLFLASAPTQGSERHLTTGDSLREILTHPAFKGFAHLILPWDDRSYDEG